MSGPYSDTTSPSPVPNWKQIEQLAARLGFPASYDFRHPQTWGLLHITALNNIIDRLDKIEAEGKEINRG